MDLAPNHQSLVNCALEPYIVDFRSNAYNMPSLPAFSGNISGTGAGSGGAGLGGMTRAPVSRPGFSAADLEQHRQAMDAQTSATPGDDALDQFLDGAAVAARTQSATPKETMQ
jgi:hypothetical protein